MSKWDESYSFSHFGNHFYGTTYSRLITPAHHTSSGKPHFMVYLRLSYSKHSQTIIPCHLVQLMLLSPLNLSSLRKRDSTLCFKLMYVTTMYFWPCGIKSCVFDERSGIAVGIIPETSYTVSHGTIYLWDTLCNIF